MKTIKSIFLASVVFLLGTGLSAQAQNKIWALSDCINYALSKNVQVQQATLTNNQDQLLANQAKANRLPSVNASVSQNFNWYKGFDSLTGGYGSSTGSNNSNYAVNSSVVLFNGEKLSNKIKQSEIDLQSSHFNSEAVRESVGLYILNAYLQVLYAQESVSNAEKQIESTGGQLELAKERMDLGVISMSDYLQIKSELANEKSTLASAKSQLAIDKVSLMQLMELPVDPNFEIASPNLDSLLVDKTQPNSQEIYQAALGIKPEIKTAELNKESAELDVNIAKADFLPSLSMGASLSSNYSSLTSSSYTTQLGNKINPSLGLSLSIPIFQKKQIKTNVGLANIAVSNAELNEINAKNTLRKDIEQACVDIETAQSQYAASLEQMESSQEAYDVTEEKYKVGLLNSVDFLVQKTNLITSQSNLLQSKYNLIFSFKVLDFYKGIPLAL